ncbi:N-6 DNA methylase [Streptomyces sp. RKAG337]|uniref:N-6 DNA methylase n=1 Tax=Streptomyces sp. RKAG337 TaxID=2893404 RepID=UPI00203440D4|nr:N-6 DNA methylase [Streptomyces sp. RKAG337]MCM2430926.1 SAM-dependent methyltransferase [Streptomyces sp. RKAG337]
MPHHHSDPPIPPPSDAAWWLPLAWARRAFLHEDPEHQARQITDIASAAWPSGASVEVPLGALAAVALLPLADPDAPDLAQSIAALRPDDLMIVLRGTWAELWGTHPYLVERAHLLYRWLADVPPDTAESVTELVHLALRAGLLEFGADPDRRLATDLLGRLLQRLTSRANKAGRGAFHTPSAVCDLISEIVGREQIIGEVAAGSGAMWRAEARLMRRDGLDPARFTWVGAEIDPLAVGVLAANAMLWRLGDDVLIACADSLAGDSGLAHAGHERHSATAHRDAVIRLLDPAGTDNPNDLA